jgi:hypothetical protein
LATPWWVNLLLLVPVLLYLLASRQRFRIGKKPLLVAALFGIAFAFVEAAVVVYLRAAAGVPPGGQTATLDAFPAHLLSIERFREAATLVMLAGLAWFAGQRFKEKLVAFLWTFAFWDLFYYLWLRLTIGWPASLLTNDVLFLLPVPWIAQVWFPILVSGLTVVVIWFRS